MISLRSNVILLISFNGPVKDGKRNTFLSLIEFLALGVSRSSKLPRIGAS